MKRNPSDSVKHIIDYIPQLTAWQWGFGAAVIVLLAVLETSFQLHTKEVRGFEGRISGLNSTIEALEERRMEARR